MIERKTEAGFDLNEKGMDVCFCGGSSQLPLAVEIENGTMADGAYLVYLLRREAEARLSDSVWVMDARACWMECEAGSSILHMGSFFVILSCVS
ncbi:hypothetical protein NL676_015749 [Syzygium grande]|nr:hypothetical protein NL676_015749 [Syzygium grande]